MRVFRPRGLACAWVLGSRGLARVGAQVARDDGGQMAGREADGGRMAGREADGGGRMAGHDGWWGAGRRAARMDRRVGARIEGEMDMLMAELRGWLSPWAGS